MHFRRKEKLTNEKSKFGAIFRQFMVVKNGLQNILKGQKTLIKQDRVFLSDETLNCRKTTRFSAFIFLNIWFDEWSEIFFDGLNRTQYFNKNQKTCSLICGVRLSKKILEMVDSISAKWAKQKLAPRIDSMSNGDCADLLFSTYNNSR